MRFPALLGGVPMRRKAPQIWLCVLAWVAALLPFSLFATCEECQQTVSNLLERSNVSYSSSSSIQGSTASILNLQMSRSVRSLQNLHPEIDFSSLLNEVVSAESLAHEISNSNNVVMVNLNNIISTLNNFSCDCDSSLSCGCAEHLEQIENLIAYVEDAIRSVEYSLANVLYPKIDSLYDSLSSIYDILGFGFYNVTNILSDISTNLFKQIGNFGSWVANEKNTYLMSGNQLRPYSRDWSTYVRTQRAFYPLTNGLLPSMYAFQYIHFLELSSINNYLYDFSFNQFPILTNTVGTLTRESTNFFKTAIAEVRPPHALADWTSQDGSIYDYLTNQYIQARNSSESNWFGRVETLLAALVYQSSVSHDEELTELESGLDDVMDQQSELESQIYFEDYIEFLNFDDLSQPALPDLQSRLPEVLSIKLGSFGSWLSDGSDFTIDIHPSEIRTLIEIIRGFFRLIWWGVVLGFVYLLWGWFVRLLKWVWSTLKGVDF